MNLMRKTLFLFFLFSFFIAGGCAKTGRPIKAKKEKPTLHYHIITSNLKAYQGKVGESLEDLEKAAKIYPGDPYLKYLMALRFAELQRWDDARHFIEEVLKQKPHWTFAEVLLGKILDAQGDYAKASRIFETAVKEEPANEANFLQLAQTLVNRKKYAEAIRLLRGRAADRPEDTLYLYYIATIQSAYLNDLKGSVATYRKILSIDPENVRVRQQLAQIYARQGNAKGSLEQFLAIENYLPNDLSVKLQIASLYHDLKKVEESVAKLEDILRINPQADKIHYFLALILEENGRHDGALQHFARVPEVSAFYKDSLLHQALIYRELKRPKEGIAVLEEGIQQEEKASQLYQILAVLWEEMENTKKAAAVLKKGIEKIPDDEQLHFNLGVLYDRMKERELSIQVMRRVIAINPNNTAALNYIGYVYAERGEKLEEAEEMIRRALKIRPDDGYIIDSLGWLYFQKGDIPNALLYVRKALQAVPGEPTIVEHMGDIFLKQGKKAEALKYFRKAMELGRKKEKPNIEEIRRVEEKIRSLTA